MSGSERAKSAFLPSSSNGQSAVTSASTSAQAQIQAKITAGKRCTIAQDCDIRGTVLIGDESVIHPKAIIHALDEEGSIEIGAQCIVEELAQIIFRGSGRMVIGNQNLFEVGCRVEAPLIGSHNTFACKSRTQDNVVIQDFTVVGAGCVAEPPAAWEASSTESKGEGHIDRYIFPSRSVIYGDQSRTRLWSGNGVQQADALHAKHLDHLRRNIPEYHKLRII